MAAQWLNYPEARTPRTKDGKPNLKARAPRRYGRPDLTGVWFADRAPAEQVVEIAKLQVDVNDIGKYGANIFWDVKPEDQPLRPEAVAIINARKQENFPGTRCLPAGVPLGQFNDSFKMIQTPEEIVVIDEFSDPPRQIFLDGRNLPKDPQPTWMGYSVGKWDGETLVVETAGFNALSWLDGLGRPRSEQMRIREKYHRRDFGHMDWEITFDDPKYYTRPFTVKIGLTLIPDTNVIEFVCGENERDAPHLGKP
jgi:hypothetical protein